MPESIGQFPERFGDLVNERPTIGLLPEESGGVFKAKLLRLTAEGQHTLQDILRARVRRVLSFGVVFGHGRGLPGELALAGPIRPRPVRRGLDRNPTARRGSTFFCLKNVLGAGCVTVTQSPTGAANRVVPCGAWQERGVQQAVGASHTTPRVSSGSCRDSSCSVSSTENNRLGLPSWLYRGDGDDLFKGDAGNDVIDDGTSNDQHFAGDDNNTVHTDARLRAAAIPDGPGRQQDEPHAICL